MVQYCRNGSQAPVFRCWTHAQRGAGGLWNITVIFLSISSSIWSTDWKTENKATQNASIENPNFSIPPHITPSQWPASDAACSFSGQWFCNQSATDSPAERMLLGSRMKELATSTCGKWWSNSPCTMRTARLLEDVEWSQNHPGIEGILETKGKSEKTTRCLEVLDHWATEQAVYFQTITVRYVPIAWTNPKPLVQCIFPSTVKSVSPMLLISHLHG